MISIAYQTEFVGCKGILSIFGNVGGTARIIVSDTSTMDVVKEVSDIGTEDALQSFMPDVFFFGNGVGYVQAWKCGNSFWIECKGVNGKYFTRKFHGYDMVNTCESYFNALRTGYPLWEV